MRRRPGAHTDGLCRGTRSWRRRRRKGPAGAAAAAAPAAGNDAPDELDGALDGDRKRALNDAGAEACERRDGRRVAHAVGRPREPGALGLVDGRRGVLGLGVVRRRRGRVRGGRVDVRSRTERLRLGQQRRDARVRRKQQRRQHRVQDDRRYERQDQTPGALRRRRTRGRGERTLRCQLRAQREARRAGHARRTARGGRGRAE